MDDLISRQAAIKAIEERAKKIKNGDTLNGLAGAVAILFDLPSVNPQPKTGHWILIEYWYDVGRRVKCSECGQVFCLGEEVSRNYCANCGARMVEPQESEETND